MAQLVDAEFGGMLWHSATASHQRCEGPLALKQPTPAPLAPYPYLPAALPRTTSVLPGHDPVGWPSAW